jgi:hypothetical protein
MNKFFLNFIYEQYMMYVNYYEDAGYREMQKHNRTRHMLS